MTRLCDEYDNTESIHSNHSKEPDTENNIEFIEYYPKQQDKYNIIMKPSLVMEEDPNNNIRRQRRDSDDSF